ncbi:LysR family transcriptional regulator [Nordella sp. HKS 07]|uniref:LysR family transcriptional regulator n=1 Tax=Nordella sp. HKS 07 TaxID=2712222 RepID=UPI0013E123A7|nr:LysR substrate-binding domain-containing protein [Nordella sp. HKS 07]QIG50539.1 LysR family transcriptional regulator [Nordella sp. HKS 07]
MRHIEVFHAIKQAGSISKAAVLLGVSQPAASKVLQHAESSLGFKLFERVKGRLLPTAEAELLYVEVAKLNTGLDQLRKLSANLRRFPQGRLHVGCLPSLGLSIMPQTIHEFRKTCPSVVCEVETNHIDALIAGLRSRQLDLAVSMFPDEHPDIRTQVIGEVDLVYLGPHDGGEVDLAEIQDHEFVGLSRSDGVGGMIAHEREKLGCSYAPAIEVQTYYLACAFAAAGCGAAVVDRLTAQSMLRPGLFLRKLKQRLIVHMVVLTHEANVIRGFYTDFGTILRKSFANTISTAVSG